MTQKQLLLWCCEIGRRHLSTSWVTLLLLLSSILGHNLYVDCLFQPLPETVFISNLFQSQFPSRLVAEVTSVKHPTNVLTVKESIFVSSFMNNQVLRLNKLTEKTEIFASGVYCLGNFECAILDGPWGLAVQSEVLYVASFGSDQILQFDLDTGTYLGYLGDSSSLDSPEGIRFGPDGLLYVVSYLRNEVVSFNVTTRKHKVFAQSDFLNGPEDLIFDQYGNLLVTSYYNNSIVRFGKDGRVQAVIGHAQEIDGPVGLALGPDNNIYVASYRQNRVVRYHGMTGQFMGLFASGKRLRGPSGVCFANDGVLYVTSYENNQIFLFDRRRRLINTM